MRICSFFKTILLSISLILLGCVSKASIPIDELPGASKIVYHFKDRSVPPEYHRSYTIEVTKDSSSCIVDSYGNIICSFLIMDKDSPVPPMQPSDEDLSHRSNSFVARVTLRLFRNAGSSILFLLEIIFP